MAKRKKLKVKNISIFVVIIFVICFGIYKLITKNDFKIKLDKNVFKVGEEYSDDFTATYKGKDVTEDVEVTHNIYSNSVGKYNVVFSYKVNSKEYKVTKTIEIVDDIAPDIILKSGDTIMVVLGTKYIEPGYSAEDNYDGNITSKVEVIGEVNTEEEGDYTIKYSVSDSSGNKSIEKRKVTVTKESPLTMSLEKFSLNGFFTNALLSETKDAGEEYTNSFIYAGDSTALYYVMNKVISSKQLWHKEGVSLETVFTQNIYINHVDSKMTLIEAIKEKQPEKVLLSLGTNSVSTMEITYFIEKYEQLLKEIKKESPSTLLIVQSIFPVAASLDESGKGLNNDKINKMNYYLLELCSKLDIPFLNTAEVLKDEKGQLKKGYYRTSTGENGVHLSKEGNEEAMKYFRTHAYEN